MIDLIKLELPTSEQLEDYRAMRWALECRPEAVSPEQKLAFCQLVLGMSPGLLDINDVKLVKKFYPEEWRAYCEFHWDRHAFCAFPFFLTMNNRFNKKPRS
jgi:hypothetical protein